MDSQGRKQVRWRLAMVVLVVVMGAAACSSGGSDAGSTSSTAAGPDATSFTGGKTAAEQKDQADGAKSSAQDAACTTELRTIETAVQAYRAVNDAAPSTVADLVPDLLKEAPENWELGPPAPDGNPTVIPTEAGVAAGCQAEG